MRTAFTGRIARLLVSATFLLALAPGCEPEREAPPGEDAQLRAFEEDVAQVAEGIRRMKTQIWMLDSEIELYPHDPLPHHKRGIAHLALGNTEEAIASMREAVGIEPGNAGFRMALADALIRDGKHGDAADELSIIIDGNPENIEALFNRGRAHLMARNLEEAVADYTSVIHLNPGHRGAHNFRSIVFAELSDHSRALEDVTRVIELSPGDINAHLWRARVHLMAGDPEKCESDVREAELLAGTLHGRPESYCLDRSQFEDWEAYVRALEEAVGPTDAEIEKLMELVARVDRRIKDAPEDPALHHERGGLHLKLGNTGEAIASLRDAVRIEPENPGFRMALADALIRGGEHENAIALLNAVIEENPGNIEAILMRASAYQDANSLKEALADYALVIRLDPAHADAHHRRGKIFLLLEDHARAIEELTRAIELRPDHSDAYLARSMVYRLVGDLEKSESDFQESVRATLRR